ncbi:hypothetical protein B2G51_01145 [Leptospira santarosai]|nr:hypothetical protein B2G51_01145 [Leptospira santarosai]OLY60507.1 hypothetical protein BV917_10600 [Leptospira santarosai serovar Guaricura]
MGGSQFGICRATFITLLSSKQNSEPTLKTRSFFYDFVFLQQRKKIKNEIKKESGDSSNKPKC